MSKNKLYVPTRDELNSKLNEVKILLGMAKNARIPIKRKYWKMVVYVSWLNRKLPNSKSFQKWIDHDHFPQYHEISTAIRRLFAMNPESNLVLQHGAYPWQDLWESFPWNDEFVITDSIIKWVERNDVVYARAGNIHEPECPRETGELGRSVEVDKTLIVNGDQL